MVCYLIKCNILIVNFQIRKILTKILQGEDYLRTAYFCAAWKLQHKVRMEARKYKSLFIKQNQQICISA